HTDPVGQDRLSDKADRVAAHDVVRRAVAGDVDSLVVAGHDVPGGGAPADRVVMGTVIEPDAGPLIAQARGAAAVRADRVARDDVVRRVRAVEHYPRAAVGRDRVAFTGVADLVPGRVRDDGDPAPGIARGG